MRLDEYLKQKGMTATGFAQIHKINLNSVYNVIRGRGGKLLLKTAIKISKATEGHVTPEDLLQGSPDWLPRAHYRLARTKILSKEVPFKNIVLLIKEKKQKQKEKR